MNAGRFTPGEAVQPDREAGSSTGRKITMLHDTQSKISMANLTLEEELPKKPSLESLTGPSNSEFMVALKRINSADCYTEPEANQEMFFTDMDGSSNQVETGFPNPVLGRSLSVSSLDSNEEVILFSGRNHAPTKPRSTASLIDSFRPMLSPEPSTFCPILEPIHTSSKKNVTIVNDPISMSTKRNTLAQPLCLESGISAGESHTSALLGCDHKPDSKRSRRDEHKKRSLKEIGVDEILTDYIEHIDDGEQVKGSIKSYMGLRPILGTTDSEGWQDQSSDYEPVHQSNKSSRDIIGWDSTDLKDFYDLSTSDEVQDRVERVLSKRTRASGVQYLIVWQGYTVDDARWILQSSLDAPNAVEEIRIFESGLLSMGDTVLESEQSYDSAIMDEKVAADLQDELDDINDEQNLLNRKQAMMTDEQIARLLSKQEVLGLGSDELVLFDGDEGHASRGWDDEVAPRPLSFWNRIRAQPTKRIRNRNNLISAGNFTDLIGTSSYNDFDIMDRDRPSLRTKSKGQVAWELSDSELENAVQTVWEKDRSRKKIRKQEREELRAQGLLGKKGNVDLKAKYMMGMSWEDVKREIGEFLVSSKETWVSILPQSNALLSIAVSPCHQ